MISFTLTFVVFTKFLIGPTHGVPHPALIGYSISLIVITYGCAGLLLMCLHRIFCYLFQLMQTSAKMTYSKLFCAGFGAS